MLTVKVKVKVDPSYADADKVAEAMEAAATKLGAIVMTKIVTREGG